MSYELADGSMSTDYKIGDEFKHVMRLGIWSLQEDDGTNMPFFSNTTCSRYALTWSLLIHALPKKDATLINQLHATIRQLKATIEELEQ
jgi:hypothetical protein